MKRFLCAAAGLLAIAPTTALACPACATREGPGLAVLALIGAMIAVPYLVALVTIRVFRKLGSS